MNQAMNHVERVTQRNASAAQELAATVEEMSAAAESLRDLVAYFRVEDTAFRRAPAARVAPAGPLPRAA